MRSMNGRRILAATVVAVVSASAFVIGGVKAQSPAQAPVAASSAAPKKAEEQFKNILVLKGIPADQLIPSMQFITASLGVECDFCHVQGAFEKDDKKPKQTARKMMEMMFAINKDDFDGHREVTCNSCHRGSTDPVAIPAVMTEEPKMAMAEPKKSEPEANKGEGDAKESTGPPAEQLFDKYVQASGGATAIEKVTSRAQKGTIDFGGKSFPIEVYSKDPDKRISFTHMGDADSITAFDGHEGWLGTPGRPLREMHGGDLEGAAMDADLHFATHLKQMFSEAKVRGTEKVGDHDTYVVVGRREAKPPVRLYFDQRSALLLRIVRYGETALGRLPTQIDYADYRPVNGVTIPFRWTLARPSGRFTIQVTDTQQNVPVDDAKFAKPPAPPEPKPPAK
jgi:photosynthetic reaction center cytochrome c subunit